MRDTHFCKTTIVVVLSERNVPVRLLLPSRLAKTRKLERMGWKKSWPTTAENACVANS